ncbi:hypothetical protein A6E15_18215 [Natrinema saccharevitans]|uniref:Uncharacterized protein n=1 Tax=Natrinema saccharevitans TaxID=301967 RepID=A0A1S8ARZ0_9EURY|nr:hypothetical protein A6E15_18215 [Natrinema saccharevitans]
MPHRGCFGNHDEVTEAFGERSARITGSPKFDLQCLFRSENQRIGLLLESSANTVDAAVLNEEMEGTARTTDRREAVTVSPEVLFDDRVRQDVDIFVGATVNVSVVGDEEEQRFLGDILLETITEFVLERC